MARSRPPRKAHSAEFTSGSRKIRTRQGRLALLSWSQCRCVPGFPVIRDLVVQPRWPCGGRVIGSTEPMFSCFFAGQTKLAGRALPRRRSNFVGRVKTVTGPSPRKSHRSWYGKKAVPRARIDCVGAPGRGFDAGTEAVGVRSHRAAAGGGRRPALGGEVRGADAVPHLRRFTSTSPADTQGHKGGCKFQLYSRRLWCRRHLHRSVVRGIETIRTSPT